MGGFFTVIRSWVLCVLVLSPIGIVSVPVGAWAKQQLQQFQQFQQFQQLQPLQQSRDVARASVQRSTRRFAQRGVWTPSGSVQLGYTENHRPLSDQTHKGFSGQLAPGLDYFITDRWALGFELRAALDTNIEMAEGGHYQEWGFGIAPALTYAWPLSRKGAGDTCDNGNGYDDSNGGGSGYGDSNGDGNSNDYGGACNDGNARGTLWLMPRLWFGYTLLHQRPSDFITSVTGLGITNTHTLRVGVYLPLIFHISSHVYIGGGPELIADVLAKLTRGTGNSTNEQKLLWVGLRSIIGVWL